MRTVKECSAPLFQECVSALTRATQHARLLCEVMARSRPRAGKSWFNSAVNRVSNDATSPLFAIRWNRSSLCLRTATSAREWSSQARAGSTPAGMS